MRTRWVVLAVMLFIPVGAAQVQVLEDPDDDAQATAGGAPVDGADTAHVDLVGLDVSEEPESMLFELRVASLDPDSGAPFERTVFHADFQHRDVPYRIEYIRDTIDGTPRYDARLMMFDPGRGDYIHIDRVDLDVDVEGGAMTSEVPRHWLLDGNGTAPSIGRELTFFKAFARTQSAVFGSDFSQVVQVRDAMPDSGFGEAPYPVSHGLPQRGDARLWSDNPVRASNGEKATFVFYVEAENRSPDESLFDLETIDVPEGWEVTLPAPQIRIDGNFSRTFPILVAVPFQHDHGAFEEFVLEMRSQRDSDSIGRVQLGIRYLAIPQPAGHHDRLHFHAREDPSQNNGLFSPDTSPVIGYMNTLEEDDRAQDVAVPPREGGVNCCLDSYTWRVFLEPGLEMGLDFDRNRTGTVDVRFQADASQDTWALGGRLVHLEGEPGPDGSLRGARETVLADLTPTSPQAISSGTAFEAVLQPTKASDMVPYTKHAALALDLELTSEAGFGGPTTPQTQPMLDGGQMVLPLNEYRDPLQGVFQDLVGVRMLHDSPAERKVNPGDTVLFNLTLTNTGALDDVFDLRVNGTNADWARLLGDQRVFVGTGNDRTVVVAVSPPADAPQGDVIDLIVTAASASDETVQGNVRVVALVDDLVDHPDESHLVRDVEKELSKKKTSPGIGWILPLAPLAWLALRRR